MILFLTRKYPPATGGMETFSYELGRAYAGPKLIVHRGRQQRDVVWALPLLLWSAFRSRREVKVFHLGDGVLCLLAPLIRLFSGAPVVSTFHALELTYPSRLLAFLIRRSLGSVTHFVAVSDYTRGLLLEAGVPSERISVIVHGADHLDPIANSVDRANATRALVHTLPVPLAGTLEKHPDAAILVTVGRLVHRKGVRWFVEHVLDDLRASSPVPLVYLIIGEGPERAALEAALGARGRSDVAALLGRVERGVLDLAYRAATAFVMPNIQVPGDAEGFGFVAIEAAYRGATVVTSRLEGITSAIHDGENGLLLPPADATAWRNCLLALLADRGAAAELGERAERYTREHFTWQKSAEEYRALFATLMQE